MIHVTSLRVELSEQVTTPTILICNINNETIRSSCKQFSTVQCIQIIEHCYIYDEQAQFSFLQVNTLALHTKYIKFKGNALSNVMQSIFIRYLSCLANSCPVFSCPAISCPAFSVNLQEQGQLSPTDRAMFRGILTLFCSVHYFM